MKVPLQDYAHSFGPLLNFPGVMWGSHGKANYSHLGQEAKKRSQGPTIPLKHIPQRPKGHTPGSAWMSFRTFLWEQSQICVRTLEEMITSISTQHNEDILVPEKLRDKRKCLVKSPVIWKTSVKTPFTKQFCYIQFKSFHLSQHWTSLTTVYREQCFNWVIDFWKNKICE